MDSEKHKFYTGVDNAKIHKNAQLLMESDVPFKVRIPFILGVNTDEENIRATCEFIKDAPNLKGIELLPYNEMAGAKYRLVGKTYDYDFKKPSEDVICAARNIIESYGINCYVQ
jgi:pyruvate formate lyase activating enzyme